MQTQPQQRIVCGTCGATIQDARPAVRELVSVCDECTRDLEQTLLEHGISPAPRRRTT